MFFITRSSKYDIKFSLFLLLYFHYYNFVVDVLLFIFIFNVHFAFYIISPCPVIAHLPNIYQSRQSIINHANLQIKHHTKNTLFTQSTCPNINANQQQIHHRSIADGQSQHSFSNNSHRGYLGTAFPSNLVNSRPELRQSRQSLAAPSERMSRASYAGSIHGGPTSVASSTRRSRPRSRSRDQLNATHIHNHRPGSR